MDTAPTATTASIQPAAGTASLKSKQRSLVLMPAIANNPSDLTPRSSSPVAESAPTAAQQNLYMSTKNYIFEEEIEAYCSKKPQSVPTELHIFDFDSTLFRSPMPNPSLWSPDVAGALIGDCGWFSEPRTLAPPYVPKHPGDEWFDQKVVRRVRQVREDKDVCSLVCLLTGRRLDLFGQRIREICLSLDPPLDFDMYFFREGFDSSNTKHHFPTTLDFKLAVLGQILNTFPSITRIEIFDDRARHLDIFSREFRALIDSGRLQSFESYHVIHDPTFDRSISPPELELELAESLLGRCNERIQSALEREILELMEAEKALQPMTVDDGGLNVASTSGGLAAPMGLRPSPSCPNVAELSKGQVRRVRRPSVSMFRDFVETCDEVRFTAVVLDPSEKLRLMEWFPPPKYVGKPSQKGGTRPHSSGDVNAHYGPEQWTPYGEQMTVSQGKARLSLIEGLGGVGAHVSLRVVAVGMLENKVIAIKVDRFTGDVDSLSGNWPSPPSVEEMIAAHEAALVQQQEKPNWDGTPLTALAPTGTPLTALAPTPSATATSPWLPTDADLSMLPPASVPPTVIRISENKVPHITMYVCPGARPRDSNQVIGWVPCSEDTPIVVKGTVKEIQVTGLRRITNTAAQCRDCVHAILQMSTTVSGVDGFSLSRRQPPSSLARCPAHAVNKSVVTLKHTRSNVPAAVSIGRLVTKHHPGLSGPGIGAAVQKVVEWMEKTFLDNVEGNRAMIEYFVSQLEVDGN